MELRRAEEPSKSSSKRRSKGDVRRDRHRVFADGRHRVGVGTNAVASYPGGGAGGAQESRTPCLRPRRAKPSGRRRTITARCYENVLGRKVSTGYLWHPGQYVGAPATPSKNSRIVSGGSSKNRLRQARQYVRGRFAKNLQYGRSSTLLIPVIAATSEFQRWWRWPKIQSGNARNVGRRNHARVARAVANLRAAGISRMHPRAWRAQLPTPRSIVHGSGTSRFRRHRADRLRSHPLSHLA
jgi:hypothetical protein